jgi:spermidine synthase
MPTPRHSPHLARAARAPRVPSLPWWGALCFFASGAAGLLYEVVWSKQLSYLLGNSLHAVTTVVAAFLCGLALGARFLGVPLARRGNGARIYAALELGVGVLGVLTLPLLRGLDPLIGECYRAVGGESTTFALIRFGLAFASLLPAAALMGATLPVLVAHFEHGLVGPALARLYALNTFGAVAGSLAGGFALLPGLGLAGTTWFAAALNVVVALIAWNASRAAGRPAGAPAPAAGNVAGGLAGGARVAFVLLFALSGVAALTFQIAWVRLFSLVFGSSVYSFSAVLGIYLLGLAIGSSLIARLMGRGVSLVGFSRIQMGLAVVAGITLHAFSRLPQWMYELGERSGAHWGRLLAGEALLTAVLLLAPCALLGAAFPVGTRLLQRRDGGHATGFAYAINTVGTITGSLAAGFFAVPTWGVQGTHLSALLLSLAIGSGAYALALGRRESSGRDLALAVGAVLVVGGLSVSAPRWDPSLMSAGLFRPAQAENLTRNARQEGGEGSLVWRGTRNERVLYYREGVNGSVLVGTSLEGRSRWLRVGGKIDASTDDMETQVLLGLIPAALADSGARTLVIGLGSGITAASVLAAGAGPTDVVELEPAVVEASRFFHGPGESPLDDPRVRLVLGDARTHLMHGAGRYGVVVSEPSNPWIAGVNNLFTVDFYRSVRAHLEPDGVFCQWMQLYELSPGTFSSMLASFFAVFPEGQVFSVWRAMDVLLVAVPEGRRLALERLESPAARRLLGRARIYSPNDVVGYYADRFAALRPAARGAPLNRDDRPIVEYRAPRDLVAVGRTGLESAPPVLRLVPFASARPAGPLFSSWSEDGWYETRARLLIERGDLVRAEATARGARTAGLARLADRLDGEVAAGGRRQPGLASVKRARLLLAVGSEQEGQAELQHAVELDPTNSRTWLMLGDRFRLSGAFAAAESAIARGSTSTDPEVQAEAAGVAGMLAMSEQRPLEAAKRFREAAQLSPRLAKNYGLEARACIAAGDRRAARDAIRRGLASLPGDPSLMALQAELGVESR